MTKHPVKLMWHLVPVKALAEVVWGYTIGVIEEKDKQQKSEDELFDSLWRHFIARQDGEIFDESDNKSNGFVKHHMAAVAFYALEIIKRDLERAEKATLEDTRRALMEAIEEHEERGDMWAGKRRNLSESIMRSSVQSCPCDRLGTGGTKYQGE